MKMTTLVVLGGIVLGGCCSCPDRTPAQPQTLSGVLYVIGNEPFTRIALETEKGEMVVLECEKAVETTLRSNQGKKVEVDFEGTKETPLGKAVNVVHARIIIP